MLTAIFLFCALVGGTVLVIQFGFLLAGFGGEHVDAGVDFSGDIDVDVNADFDIEADAADIDSGEMHHDSSWFFGVISFRSLVAAVAFFGITGMIAHTTGAMHPVVELLVATGGGVLAMFLVFWLMLGVKSLAEDGTTKIETAIGKIGTVYVPIPAEKSAAGKIQVKVNNRLEEFAAVTSHTEKLTTGSCVRVTGVVGNSTLEVAPPAQSE